MLGGRPVRLEEGEDVRRAQSSGECPGVRRTLRRGLVGMELWVGGGTRDEKPLDGGPRFGRGERIGGDMSPPPAVIEGVAWTGFDRGGP